MKLPIVVGDTHGIHYAVTIFIATAILWLLLQEWADLAPIWAISSMIASSDPNVDQAISTFRGRVLNAALGCAIGMIFLLAGGNNGWIMPIALAVTVLVTSYWVRIPVMWRQAPITAAIVIAGGVHHHSRLGGAEEGLKRVGEVMLGCVVGLTVTWLTSKIWPLPDKAVTTSR